MNLIDPNELMEKINKVKYARKLLAKRLISECKTYQTSEKEEAWPIYLEGDGYSDGQLVYDEAFCPACDYLLTDEYDPATEYEPYCPHCGHRISWNEFKEEIDRLCEEKREENE